MCLQHKPLNCWLKYNNNNLIMYAHSYTLHYSIHEASSCDMISYWMKPYHNIISYIVIIIILIFILVIILIVVIILMNNHFFFFYVSSFFFNTTIFR